MNGDGHTEHLKKTHPQREFRCDQAGCEFIGASKLKLKVHKASHLPKPPERYVKAFFFC